MQHEDEIVAPAKTLLSRRKVIGTALWAAPAITLATAAPALAAVSKDTLAFSPATAATSINGGQNQLTIPTSVVVTKGDSTSIAANGLVVVINFTGSGMTPASTGNQVAPSGWTVSVTGNNVTFTHTAAISASGTQTFSPTVKISGYSTGKSVGLTATAAGYATGNGSATT